MSPPTSRLTTNQSLKNLLHNKNEIMDFLKQRESCRQALEWLVKAPPEAVIDLTINAGRTYPLITLMNGTAAVILLRDALAAEAIRLEDLIAEILEEGDQHGQ